MENVPVDALKALAGSPGPSGQPQTQTRDKVFTEVTKARGTTFDLEAWITRMGLTVVATKPWEGGHLWILDACFWNPEHTNKAAFIGRHASGAIFARCLHNSCAGKGWHDLRDALEPGWREKHPIEAVDDPDRLARLFIERGCQNLSGFTLRSYQSDWYWWNGISYLELPDYELGVRLIQLIKPEFDRISVETRTTARKVLPALLAGVRLALQSKLLVPRDRTMPCWLGDGPWPASEVLAAPNGLFHLPSMADGAENHVPTTPAFFSTFALDYEPRLDAPPPVTWLWFLDQLWGSDPECIDTLQEFMGYFLVNDTSLQKILMLIGPSRSGKGTIARVLIGLLGQRNVAGPTISSLKTNFGLQSLIGKPLAIISDAQLDRHDGGVAEVLKMISGEDLITIDRKYADPIPTRLTCRIVYISNELPRFKDPSGALANRMVILRLIESFLGREDSTLDGRLANERPGILLWATAGWKRLMARGRFVQPKSGLPLLGELKDLGSPVGQFVRERCLVGSPQAKVPKETIFKDYLAWCDTKGEPFPLADNTFGAALRAVVPGLGTSHPRIGGKQVWFYTGIALKEIPDADE
jgi:putative DNA primase/helicase